MGEIEWVTVGGATGSNAGSAGGYDAPGICSECGEKAYHHRAKKCEEHRDSGATKAPNGRRKSGSKLGGAGKPSGANGPTADKWSRTLGKVMLIVTSFVAVGIVSRANILDSDGTLVDSLSLTEDEALDIAKPLGRFMTRTTMSKKYGNVLVDNDDFIDAALAISDYVARVRETTDRIEEVLNARRGDGPYRTNGFVSPQTESVTHVATGQNEESGQQDGRDVFGPPPGFYAQPVYED